MYQKEFIGVGVCIYNLMDDMQEYIRGLFVIMWVYFFLISVIMFFDDFLIDKLCNNILFLMSHNIFIKIKSQKIFINFLCWTTFTTFLLMSNFFKHMTRFSTFINMEIYVYSNRSKLNINDGKTWHECLWLMFFFIFLILDWICLDFI